MLNELQAAEYAEDQARKAAYHKVKGSIPHNLGGVHGIAKNCKRRLEAAIAVYEGVAEPDAPFRIRMKRLRRALEDAEMAIKIYGKMMGRTDYGA